MIKWLEDWYLSQCNGYWEHDYGIKITTLDNPGWDVNIDLANTGINIPEEKWFFFEKSERDWYGYKIEQDVFSASGDPTKLNFLISLFKEKLESSVLQ